MNHGPTSRVLKVAVPISMEQSAFVHLIATVYALSVSAATLTLAALSRASAFSP